MLWLSLKWIRGGWDGHRIFLSGARSVCVRPPARAVSEAASPAPNISTAICLCPHPFISASASSSVLASDSPSCSIRFSSPFYSGILFSTGAPPQRRFFSSPPTFQQLEADCTIISHLFWMFNSSVWDSCFDTLSAKWRIHDARCNLPGVWVYIGNEHFDFFPHAFPLIPLDFRHFHL